MALVNALGAVALDTTLQGANSRLDTLSNNGELREAIQALRMAVQALSRSIGLSTVDTSGRLRVVAENPTAANLNATVSLAGGQTLAALTTLTTLSTLTNQTQTGGFAANDQIPALMHLPADNLRRNITVS